MNTLTLFHGSEQIIEKPDIALGKPNNDYGRGFYCTDDPELAGEWACKRGNDGFVNKYTIDAADLRMLDLEDGEHMVLNWIALLLKYRTFSLRTEISSAARDYLIGQFSVDTSDYDLIRGYRADDSYFRYAEDFVMNSLPLGSLELALRLGKLGIQTVLVSEQAFDRIEFVEAFSVDASCYYPRFTERDVRARREYREDVSRRTAVIDDIFILDIIREGMKSDDPRIQRIVSR